MLRERFDRIDIIDLRGDLRRGERAGVLNDEGVFNIQVGTAITVAIADGSKAEGEFAKVYYNDVWEHDLLTRQAKLHWLDEGAATGAQSRPTNIERGVPHGFRPEPFATQSWASLSDCFAFQSSGMQSKRDNFIYSVSQNALVRRIQRFKAAAPAAAAAMFHDSRDRTWSAAQAHPVQNARAVQAIYRPLDRRFIYNHPAFGDFLRPALQDAWGASNSCLYALPSGTGSGPAVWCHALLPDYHSFRGSYGGYAFPLNDNRPGHGSINIKQELIDGLLLSYRAPIEPQVVFNAILGLLSATSYTFCFAEDLEDVFPHVPFPASKAVFDRAAALGAQIRAIETFERAPGATFLTSANSRIETTPRGVLAAIGPSDFDAGELILCEDGTGKVTGIPARAWDFSVSGYRVLQKWLAGRVGISVDNAFITEFRDITGRINELIHLFDEADLVLQEALTHTLTRRELGLE